MSLDDARYQAQDDELSCLNLFRQSSDWADPFTIPLMETTDILSSYEFGTSIHKFV